MSDELKPTPFLTSEDLVEIRRQLGQPRDCGPRKFILPCKRPVDLREIEAKDFLTVAHPEGLARPVWFCCPERGLVRRWVIKVGEVML